MKDKSGSRRVPPMVIEIFGPQGCGKSTIASHLALAAFKIAKKFRPLSGLIANQKLKVTVSDDKRRHPKPTKDVSIYIVVHDATKKSRYHEQTT